MKINAPQSLALFLFGAGLSGCDDLRYQTVQKANQGTIQGVEQCFVHNKSQLASDDIIKNECAQKHEFELPAGLGGGGGRGIRFESLTGRANYRADGFGGSLTSGFEGYVVTSALLTTRLVPQNDDKQIINRTINVRGLWILPGETEEFFISRARIIDFDEIDQIRSSGEFSWSVRNVYGVRIEIE